MMMDWQTIDTAPRRDDVDVLIWDGSSMAVAHWVNDDQWQPDGQPCWTPTHWMAISPPKDFDLRKFAVALNVLMDEGERLRLKQFHESFKELLTALPATPR